MPRDPRSKPDNSEDDILKLIWSFVTVCFGFIVGCCVGVYTAFVFTILWSWFITPQFSVPAPSVAVMYGIILMITVATIQYPNRDNTPEEKELEFSIVVKSIAKTLFVSLLLGVCYIAHIAAIAGY